MDVVLSSILPLLLFIRFIFPWCVRFFFWCGGFFSWIFFLVPRFFSLVCVPRRTCVHTGYEHMCLGGVFVCVCVYGCVSMGVCVCVLFDVCLRSPEAHRIPCILSDGCCAFVRATSFPWCRDVGQQWQKQGPPCTVQRVIPRADGARTVALCCQRWGPGREA